MPTPTTTTSTTTAAGNAPASILILGLGELGTAVLAAIAAHPSFDPARTSLAVLRRSNNKNNTPAATTTLASLLGPTTTTAGVSSSSSSPGEEEDGGRNTAAAAAAGTTQVRLESADLATDPVDALAALFARYDVVVQCTGFTSPRGTLLRVAEAAVAAGKRTGGGGGGGGGAGRARLKRFVPWQFGVDYDAVWEAAEKDGGGAHKELVAEMRAVRALLREQEQAATGTGTGTGTETRTRWTVVSTGLFMSFLFLKEFGVVDLESRTVRGLGGWRNRVTVTSVEGIGRMVAEVVFGGEDENEGIVYAAGDTLTYREVAEIVEKGFGGEWRKEEWDGQTLKRMLEERPGDVMVKYQNMFGAGAGVSWEMERTLNHKRGIKLPGLREYLEENKERLLKEAGRG